MIELAKQEIEQIRTLLRNPTPESFDAVNRKLEQLAGLLNFLKDSLASGGECDSTVRTFMTQLPAEMSRIRSLLQAPIDFFGRLNSLRGAKFGSYDQTGMTKSFEFQLRTRMHIQL